MNFKVVTTAMAALVVSVLFVVPAEAQGYGQGQGNYGYPSQEQMRARKMAHKQMRRDMARQQQGYGNGCSSMQAPYYESTGAYPANQYLGNGYNNSYGAYDPYVNGTNPNPYYPSSSPLRGALSGLGAITGGSGLSGVSGLNQLGNLGGSGQYGNSTGYDQYGNPAAVDQYGNPIGNGIYNTSGGLNGNSAGTASGVIQGLLGLF